MFERVRKEWGTSLVVTGATVLALGGGMVIRGLGGLGIDVVVASVAAATVLGRVGVAAPGVLRRRWWWLLPVFGAGAGVVGALMAGRHVLLGGALFVLAAATAAGARAVRSAWTATGLVASAPAPVLVALVAPSPVLDAAHVIGTACAVTCGAAGVLGATAAGARSGLLVAPERPPRPRTVSHLRVARRTARAAVPTLLALGAALAVGRAVFAGHWTWVVLTALVVGQSGAGHGDVLRRALLRLLGASVATVVTAPLVILLPAHSALALLAIVGALVAGTWLRPLGYAYWAGSLTAVLALLQGYLDGPRPGFLVIRLGAIAVGGVLALIAARPLSCDDAA